MLLQMKIIPENYSMNMNYIKKDLKIFTTLLKLSNSLTLKIRAFLLILKTKSVEKNV